MKFLRKNLSFFMCVIGLFAFRWSFADQYVVPTGSMKPTIHEGDHILVNKVAYGFKIPFTELTLAQTGELKRGDIIVFLFPNDTSVNFVKRIVGLPGDQVEVEGKKVIVPAEHFYVMGDNRDNSYDSRYWGFVPRENIKGKALAIAWNFQLKELLPVIEWDRFGKTL